MTLFIQHTMKWQVFPQESFVIGSVACYWFFSLLGHILLGA